MGRNKNQLLAIAAVAALMVAGLVAFSGGTAAASGARARVGETPREPMQTFVAGPTPASQRLSVTVELQPRDPVGLKSFATAVSTPGTAAYGHFLTVPEFAQRFGATPAHVAAVASVLRAEGARVSRPTSNNLQLQVSGSTGQLERTFAVSEQQVRLPSGRFAYANNVAPTLPADVAGYVQGVIGLDNVNPDQPAGLVRHAELRGRHSLHAQSVSPQYPTNGGPQPCSTAAAFATAAAGGGLTADEIATAYQFSGLYGQGDLGQGQTIAMFEEQGFSPTDIATYQACYSTSASVTAVNVAGGPPASSDDGEAALDIEQAIGLAPKANILVYQGTDPVTILGAMVSQDVAKVMSSSWGECEALTGGTTINAENSLLQEAAAQGQSFFISSGDSGSSMCYQAQPSQTQLSVIDPGSQPFATGVGGTFLYTSTGGGSFYAPGDPMVEGVWNEQAPGGRASATGGGISSFFAMPAYQASAPATLGVINPDSSTAPCGASTDCREVPDVAADADPNSGYVVNSTDNTGTTSWGVVGGTSAAAPLWAAFTALANASATCRGLPIGFINPSLYSIAGSTYNSNFNDVTHPNPLALINGDTASNANSNDAIGVNGDKYQIRTGYDLATGLGSMVAPTLASSLCAARAPAYTVTVTSPGNQATFVGEPVNITVPGADSGGAALSFSATGLPAGLAMAANGVITGTPTTPGSTTVTVSAGDAFTNVGSTAFTWSVVAPPPPPPPVGKPTSKSVKISGLVKGKPKLTLTLSAGQNAPALKSVSITLPTGLSFAGKVKTLDRGLTVKSGKKKLKFIAKIKKDVLTIALKSSTRSLTLTLAKPAIMISRSEASKIRKHKVKKLDFKLKSTDTSKKTTGLTITLKKLS